MGLGMGIGMGLGTEMSYSPPYNLGISGISPQSSFPFPYVQAQSAYSPPPPSTTTQLSQPQLSPSYLSTSPGLQNSVPLPLQNSLPLPIPLPSSPLVVPPSGPLATAAFESGMSAVEELRLLKSQVMDVARVCMAVAGGDLSQKITVPVQGAVMVQLKGVINTMVGSFSHDFLSFRVMRNADALLRA